MEYYKSSDIDDIILRCNDILIFKINNNTVKYRVNAYTHGFYFDHLDTISLIMHLKIIDPIKFSKKFNCGIYSDTYKQITSNNLKDLTSIAKELFIISEKIK